MHVETYFVEMTSKNSHTTWHHPHWTRRSKRRAWEKWNEITWEESVKKKKGKKLTSHGEYPLKWLGSVRPCKNDHSFALKVFHQCNVNPCHVGVGPCQADLRLRQGYGGVDKYVCCGGLCLFRDVCVCVVCLKYCVWCTHRWSHEPWIGSHWVA